MARIERVDDRLRRILAPSLDVVAVPAVGRDDALVLCAGFEDRSIETLRRLVDSGHRGFTVMVFNYFPRLEENRSEEIAGLCEEGDVRTVALSYDREAPGGACEALIEALTNVTGRVSVDVSAMSRLLIVQTLCAIAKSPRRLESVSVLYCEAMHYPPSEAEVHDVLATGGHDSVYGAMFVSSGVIEVVIVPELSSVAMHGQPIRLVAFPSFNVSQLSALRGELQPSYMTLIHGMPPLPENRWRPGAIKTLNRTEELLNWDERTASTLHYEETLGCLLDIYAEHGAAQRLVVAPTGSKMQAVAVGMFRAFMDDVQIAYPTPRSFSRGKEYTLGVRSLYELRLDAFDAVTQ